MPKRRRKYRKEITVKNYEDRKLWQEERVGERGRKKGRGKREVK